MTDFASVESALRNAAQKLRQAVHKQNEHCYCEMNAMDHRGACGHCNEVGQLTDVVAVGVKVLEMDPAEHAIEAGEYVEHAGGRRGIWEQRERIIGGFSEAQGIARDRLKGEGG